MPERSGKPGREKRPTYVTPRLRDRRFTRRATTHGSRSMRCPAAQLRANGPAIYQAQPSGLGWNANDMPRANGPAI